MNREIISRAISDLRSEAGKVGKRGARIHDRVLDVNLHRIRALEGICGNCDTLKIDFEIRDGHKRVILRCEKGLSPVDLYRNTDFGKEAKCSGFYDGSTSNKTNFPSKVT